MCVWVHKSVSPRGGQKRSLSVPPYHPSLILWRQRLFLNSGLTVLETSLRGQLVPEILLSPPSSELGFQCMWCPDCLVGAGIWTPLLKIAQGKLLSAGPSLQLLWVVLLDTVLLEGLGGRIAPPRSPLLIPHRWRYKVQLSGGTDDRRSEKSPETQLGFISWRRGGPGSTPEQGYPESLLLPTLFTYWAQEAARSSPCPWL